jgi:hypothetical protein
MLGSRQVGRLATATGPATPGPGRSTAGGDGWWRYRLAVGTKAERRAARERVAAYHEARLGELVEYVTAAIDRYRAGEIDVYTVDETIHHYHRATGELWKFCWSGGGGTHIEIIANILDRIATEGESINWWERGAPPRRE